MRCQAFARAQAPAGSDNAQTVVAVMRDVTERKDREGALTQARGAIERAEAAKHRVLATVTHELRTPLNAVIGFSEILMREGEIKIDAVRRHDYVRLIRESGEHLLGMVNGILDMTKIERGEFEITRERLDIAPIVDTCCDLLSLKACEAGVDLTVRMGPALPEIAADRRAVTQMLLNLLSNAIKFTHSGGRVIVDVRAQASHLAFSVEDTGVGIEDCHVKQLGEPFFQVRGPHGRAREGTGLGLSIVKGLVELHGGTLDIHSRLGEGTRVTVRLPLDIEDAEHGAAPVACAQPAPDKVAKINSENRMKRRA
jgi:cell cycle sensor histidine kinase DivJ